MELVITGLDRDDATRFDTIMRAAFASAREATTVIGGRCDPAWIAAIENRG